VLVTTLTDVRTSVQEPMAVLASEKKAFPPLITLTPVRAPGSELEYDFTLGSPWNPTPTTTCGVAAVPATFAPKDTWPSLAGLPALDQLLVGAESQATIPLRAPDIVTVQAAGPAPVFPDPEPHPPHSEARPTTSINFRMFIPDRKRVRGKGGSPARNHRYPVESRDLRRSR
jgi:hypothetical protein